MLHVGVVAVGAEGEGVVGRGEDAAEAAFEGEAGGAPGGGSAFEGVGVVVTEVAEGGGGEEGLVAVAADGYQRLVAVGGEVFYLRFEPGAGGPVGAGRVALGEFLAGVDVQQGWVGQLVERLGCDCWYGLAGGGEEGGFGVGVGGEGAAGGGPGGGSAVEGVDFAVAHLFVPGGGEGGAGEAVAGEDDGGVVDDGEVVAALDGLSAGEPAEAGDTSGVVLFGAAHVDEVDAFGFGAGAECVELVDVDELDVVFGGAAAGVGFGGGAALFCYVGHCAAVGVLFELVAGEEPAGGAVFEADDVAVEGHALEGAGSDDAAGASGAVDDDGGVGRGVGEGVGDAQGEFAAGQAASAGDAESMVFFGGAGIEYDEFVAALDACVEVVGGDFGYVVDDFDALAEVFGGDVDAPFGGEVEAGPAVDAALEGGDVAVAEGFGGCGGAGDAAGVVVAED